MLHKLVRSLVISRPKSFTWSKINILNVDIFLSANLFHLFRASTLCLVKNWKRRWSQTQRSISSSYQIYQRESPWNRHFYVCSYSGYISSLLHLEYLPSYFFPPSTPPIQLGTIYFKTPSHSMQPFHAYMNKCISLNAERSIKVLWRLLKLQSRSFNVWTEFCTILCYLH